MPAAPELSTPLERNGVQAPAPAPSRASLSARFLPDFNLAYWQNELPILVELALANTGTEAFRDITVEVASDPPVLRPRTWRLDRLAPGQIWAFDDRDRDVQIDSNLLGTFTEATRGRITLTARGDGEEVAAFSQEIRFLAPNEWGGMGVIPDILAAFVQPNDPAVAGIQLQASDFLRKEGLADTLEGYQGDKKRVWQQAQAIWNAICALDIRYINPPASFEASGQRIRTATQIVEDRLATCLDTAVLFASCLEAVWLRPLIVLIRGHAFAGLWLSKGDFGTSTVDDAPGLRNRAKLDDLVLFETTLVTNTRKPAFSRAVAEAQKHVAPENDATFEALIDIHRARQRQIRPLPSSTGGYAKGAPDPDIAPAPPPPFEDAPPLRDDEPVREDLEPTTPEGRLARWRKRLLDLSGRNRLLNLPRRGRQVLWVDCPDLPKLEDRLAAMRGQAKPAPLRFRPWPDLMDGNDPRSGALHRARLQGDAEVTFAREAFSKGELLVGRGESDLQTSLTDIFRKANTDQREGGANTLFLTIGTLIWQPREGKKPYCAPLILVPVVLERPSVKSGFHLRVHDDETQLNATLLELLRQDFAIRLPALEAERPPEDAAGLDVARIIDIFRTKIRDVPGWEVRDEVALTTLSFTKFLMWKDLSERADALRGNDVARRLMDGPTVAAERENSGGDGERGAPDRRFGAALDEQLAAADLICPLEADSSQLSAVALAVTGRSFVLIGPPGTGKSQTIANIIANTLAAGKTVLFVAEKRAALEVVQRRMREVGLADFCLDLFSSKASKAAVLAQLSRAQGASERPDAAGWTDAQSELASLRAELNGYVRELHRARRNGWTPFRAIGEVLRAADGGVPEIKLSWPDEDHHDLNGWRRLVQTVEEAQRLLQRSGDAVRAPALAGIEQPDWSPVWQTRLLDAARTTSAQFERTRSAIKAALRLLHLDPYPQSRPALARFIELARVLTDPIAADAGWALADGAADVHASLPADRARADRARALRAQSAVVWRPSVMALPLATIRAEWRQASERWALPRSRAQGAIRKRLESEADGKVPADCGPELDRLVALADVEAELAATPNATTLGRHWRGAETDFDRLDAVHAWAQRLRAATASCAADPAALLALRAHVAQLVTGASDLLAPEGSIGAALRQAVSAWDNCEAASAGLAALCGSDPTLLVPPEHDDWFAAIAGHVSGWANAAPLIQDWCAWRGIAQRAGALGLAPLMRALEDGIIAPQDAKRALEANYARWWSDLAIDTSPRLRSFVAATHEVRIERFRKLDAEILGVASRLVRARVTSGIPGEAQRQHDAEYGVLTRELAKRQRHLPVRELARRMPRALRRLTPCLMMSPLSVAQFLPADAAPFDLVIFDEASQITTWDAIGAVGRGAQVIVVGDPKQLPPTSFFERRSDDDPSGPVEVETNDLDSILDECLGAAIPKVSLTWHYRSRHESLIAFSNTEYYSGSLITFPSPLTDDRAVTFRHVPNGIYARGTGRTNEAEARAVVAEALAVLRAPDTHSLGIVTFNGEQQALIENLLDQARRDDPALERHFGEDAAEPVLVRSLEGVQGEERDVMLFSLTYGPDATGRVGVNFGPLNLSGGERRLNVAITRARERLVVFGSMRADQIDLSRTAAIGVHKLKKFLAFAEQGARAFATTATAPLGDHESPFETQVAERLAHLGWTLHPQVGAGGFRIDLAVVDPDAPGAYLAGVECDGATYHSGATARDRDRLRQKVLEQLGWRILRIWSTDWWTNAGREAGRLHDALQEAHAAARQAREESRVAAPVSPPDDAAYAASVTGDAAASVSAESFYDPAYRETLARMVRDVLEREGPIRDDRLVQAIARLHGFQRAGREIRERVLDVLPRESATTSESVGRFIWPPGSDPAGWTQFRPPPRGTSHDPADLSIQELAALARSCRVVGSREGTLQNMRDACGMRRLGDAAKSRFLDAIDAATL
jgi:very-short-patch-repair endonuclease